jgi:type IV pilus assembly protein PilW
MGPGLRFRRKRGFTLVELMVSMAIGLIILAAISVVLTTHMRQQAVIDKRNRLIDNGRYALELLSENLRLAGYFGEFDTSGIPPPGATVDPCKAAAGIADLAELRRGIGHPIQAYDAMLGPSRPTSATPPASCGLSELLKPGSDVLVVRRVLTTSTAQATIPPGNASVFVQGTQCNADLPTFRVDVDPVKLDRLTLQCGATAPKAPANRLLQEIYFVAKDHVAGDGIPTLKRIELQADGRFSAPLPLVEGIEFVQFAYGIDTPVEDGVPDSYEDCSGASCSTNWDKVVSVKIYLVARDIESSADTTDVRTYDLGPGGSFTPAGAERQYRRHAYLETVHLPNVASRRELP